MADYHIRRARRQDIPSMIDLLVQLFSLEQDFEVDTQKQQRGLSLLMERDPDSCCVLVAEQAGEVVAMCSVQTSISTAMGGRAGMLEDLVVDAAHRNQGIASTLLHEVMAWCREQGIERLQLLADKANQPALDFYASRGWQGTNLSVLAHFMFQI